MFKTTARFFGPYALNGGGHMSFGIFAAGVAPLVSSTVIATAIIMYGLLGELSHFAMLPASIVAFALLLKGGSEAERKTIKDWLDQIWRVWSALGFAVVFHSLAKGAGFSIDNFLAGLPLELQCVLFALFGGTLAAYFGLFLAPGSDRR